MRLCGIFLGWLVMAVAVRADQATDLARIHIEVIGGKERIDALTSLRASGYVLAGGKKVRFSMVAARPNRVRLETGADGRRLVQASDGVGAPWKWDSGVVPPKYQAMADTEGRVFAADAEFDDPLVGGAGRGYTFDYAGEVASGGRKLLRVLVTRKLTDTFAVLVDSDTYFIVAKMETRQSPGGRRVEIVTRYEDYRPVAGVLMPHRVAVLMDGKLMQHTIIESVEPNAPVTTETFARPRNEAPAKK